MKVAWVLLNGVDMKSGANGPQNAGWLNLPVQSSTRLTPIGSSGVGGSMSPPLRCGRGLSRAVRDDSTSKSTAGKSALGGSGLKTACPADTLNFSLREAFKTKHRSFAMMQPMTQSARRGGNRGAKSKKARPIRQSFKQAAIFAGALAVGRFAFGVTKFVAGVGLVVAGAVGVAALVPPPIRKQYLVNVKKLGLAAAELSGRIRKSAA